MKTLTFNGDQAAGFAGTVSTEPAKASGRAKADPRRTGHDGGQAGSSGSGRIESVLLGLFAVGLVAVVIWCARAGLDAATW
ncbi:MAG TPA: hypothetical protein DCY13_03515 [Verrucomicrobiales bacterium]|nr:hypothetical protein [Verrucomicrobiales bacterium]